MKQLPPHIKTAGILHPNQVESTDHSMPCLMIAFAVFAMIVLFQFAIPDRVCIGNGFGWDGSLYRQYIYDFPEALINHSFDNYRILRSLPVAIAHYGLRLLHVPFSDSSIVSFFIFYGVVVQALCLFAWSQISRVLKLSTVGTLLGFTALFLNFGFAKFYAYCPVLFDSTGLLCSLASLYFYVDDNLFGLAVTSALALLCWPISLAVSAVLILFPRSLPTASFGSTTIASKIALGYGVSWAVAACSFYAVMVFQRQTPSLCPWGKMHAPWVLLPVNIALAATYLVVVLRPILARFDLSHDGLRSAFRRIEPKRLAAVVVLLAFLLVLEFVVAPKHATVANHIEFFTHATLRPLQFIPAHWIFYGPLVLSLPFVYKQFCHRTQELGLGALIVVTIALAYSTNAESRQLVYFWPFVVAPLAIALQDTKPDRLFVPRLVVVSLFFSRFWLPINWFCARDGYSVKDFPEVGKSSELPAQLYFMNHGPWTADLLMALFVCAGLMIIPLVNPCGGFRKCR